MPAPETQNWRVNLSCNAAQHIFDRGLLRPAAMRSALLAAIADALESRRDDIITTCADETALLAAELAPEFARMIGTLRMFSELVKTDAWSRPVINKPETNPAHAVGPNHDVRSILMPLGPVAVFGASNFPLAYGVCGGDTASALAAGCPVVVKEHPAHPKTGRLLAEIAICAARAAVGADGSLGYVDNEDPKDFNVGAALVQSMWMTAVGFTGSTAGGTALQKLAAERRGGPIPVFAEMGSLNTVFITQLAFERRGQEIADELVRSILLRVGQQCTKPGVIFVPGESQHAAMVQMISDGLLAAPKRRMLSAGVAENYYRRVDQVRQSYPIATAKWGRATPMPTDQQCSALQGVPVVFSTLDLSMENDPTVWEEMFGPAVIVAKHAGSAESFLPGALTVSVYIEPEECRVVPGKWEEDWDSIPRAGMDDFMAARDRGWLLECLLSKAGRIIFNGPPTGVRVCEAMIHGGPFPATNVPHTTAVGPRAIERWCRPVCFQNAPTALLPDALR